VSRRKVEKYVEAKLDYELLLKQRGNYPELKDSAKYVRDLTEAKAACLGLLRTLTGGELAAARALERTLTQKEHSDG
jgi:hypothetical protein